jgi:dipeptidyl aminopeptidase/acylaminoacyl peptidase
MRHRFIVRTTATLLATLCSIAGAAAPESIVLDGAPQPDPALMATLSQWLAGRGASFQGFLPDGGMLVSTRFGEVAQVHRVAAPGADREQLTFGEEPIAGAVAPQAPDAKGFVFLQDRGGNENAQIHYYRYSDRSLRMLTDGRSLHGSVAWSHDGRRIAFHGNGRDGVSYDVYVADVAAAAGTPPRLLVSGTDRMWSPVAWSPDDRRLLLRQFVSANESYLYVADVASGALTQVPTAPQDGAKPGRSARDRDGRNKAGRDDEDKVAIGAARFSIDGRGVWLVSDAGSEFRQLRYIDLASGSSRSFTEFLPWDIESFELGSDGRYLAFVANVDGLSRLTLIDLGAGSEIVPTGIPPGLIHDLQFDRTGRQLGMTIESAQQPPDAWTYDIERAQLTRWTRSETGPVDPGRYVGAELIRYPTWDRARNAADPRGRSQPRAIPAWVYRPRSAGPHPVIIDIHGGPESQARPAFDAFRQYLVNELGYVVIAPNVRGSSGYGKGWLKLDDGMLREDSVRDIGSLLVWIGAQRDLDATKVVVMGGSYGGYMTLASLVQYGDRLRGGIDSVGISSFVTFLENTSAYRRDLRRAEYGDERDPKMRAFLTRISPLTHAAMIRRPLLVLQGLNDPRVPASESAQLVARVRANQGEVWYVAAKDEGHGFRKKGNREYARATIAMFLRRLRD